MSDQRIPNIVRMAVNVEQRAINEDEREVLHVISTRQTDRAGDIVEPGGAILDSYKANPVVLADHNYSIDKIIGVATEITVGEDTIVARTKFDSEGIGARAWGLVKRGMARAWSIGFRPLQHEQIVDESKGGGGRVTGLRFQQWEMLEYSLVAIPMNPGAVSAGVQRGLLEESDAGLLYLPQHASISEIDEAMARPSEDAAHQPNVDHAYSPRDIAAANWAIRLLEEQRDVQRLADRGHI